MSNLSKVSQNISSGALSSAFLEQDKEPLNKDEADIKSSAVHDEHHTAPNITPRYTSTSDANGVFAKQSATQGEKQSVKQSMTENSGQDKPKAKNKKRVIVGMSGGVDSSLAAALLVERGYDVLGVYMRNWTQDLPGFACPWAQDLADAERVAVHLGIDLEVWDYEEQYKREVVNYLLDSYKHGFTPNPDVICNEKVKFGTFANAAFERGADFIATGHYARCNQKGQLFRACDEHKDQTYFLWRVPAKMLKRTIFPLGDFDSKNTVRQEAQKRGIETADKPDSVGVCFIGPISMREFLLSQFGKKPGAVIDINTGEHLGEHDGAFLFTLGQRKGLDLGGGPARWIVRVDTKENIVYVSDKKDDPHLFTRQIALQDCCWVEEDFLTCTHETCAHEQQSCNTHGLHGEHHTGMNANEQVIDCLVRTRHTRALAEAHLHINTNDPKNATLIFDETVQAVAPGQAVSLYQETRCLGGGFAS